MQDCNAIKVTYSGYKKLLGYAFRKRKSRLVYLNFRPGKEASKVSKQPLSEIVTKH